MSAKRRAALAEQGNSNPFSTLTNGAVGRGSAPRLAAPAPRRPRDTGPTPQVRALITARSGGRCEWPGCPRLATDIHHRLNRKAGGRHGEARERINSAAWLIAACRPHHDRVTSPVGAARVLAEHMGWLLREYQDAELTPVLTRHAPLPVLLTAAGTWTTHSPNQTTPTEVPA
jgi:hypothetical protein